MSDYTAEDFKNAKVADGETAELLWMDHITPRLGIEGGE